MKIAMLALILGLFSAHAFSQSADKINGEWTNDQHDKKILFHKTNDGTYEGEIIWTKGTKAKPGDTIIKGLKFRDNKYTDGQLFLPARGEWVKCSAVLKNENTLEITGSKSMFSKTVTWTK
ncbi:DUF2147 domain-containing protein [Chitinophaga oryziterrae]|uniref:DUF2147 domain-containing protein n=1 Tax=Chitinophaga oryziterrae TaxID=1031224 RepID=A0A6N8JI76_9BACT|nr:DUF2147 domain-containing protein [Chitinophaga oryziterrae]MVT43978.1 DUF2147 domain-containing protein [Chitinophaga oryziterrae]